jgi:hypothetical protein
MQRLTASIGVVVLPPINHAQVLVKKPKYIEKAVDDLAASKTKKTLAVVEEIVKDIVNVGVPKVSPAAVNEPATRRVMRPKGGSL